LALVSDTSLSAVRVARVLDRPLIERGKPKPVVSDKWQRTHQQSHIAPGKPCKMPLSKALMAAYGTSF
jgi:hypothetical protein